MADDKRIDGDKCINGDKRVFELRIETCEGDTVVSGPIGPDGSYQTICKGAPSVEFLIDDRREHSLRQQVLEMLGWRVDHGGTCKGSPDKPCGHCWVRPDNIVAGCLCSCAPTEEEVARWANLTRVRIEALRADLAAARPDAPSLELAALPFGLLRVRETDILQLSCADNQVELQQAKLAELAKRLSMMSALEIPRNTVIILGDVRASGVSVDVLRAIVAEYDRRAADEKAAATLKMPEIAPMQPPITGVSLMKNNLGF